MYRLVVVVFACLYFARRENRKARELQCDVGVVVPAQRHFKYSICHFETALRHLANDIDLSKRLTTGLTSIAYRQNPGWRTSCIAKKPEKQSSESDRCHAHHRRFGERRC
jgi:hypothetical protein